jgi:hypothetical protein
MYFALSGLDEYPASFPGALPQAIALRPLGAFIIAS